MLEKVNNSNFKILIADDDYALKELIKDQLTNRNFHVELAEDGVQAISIFQKQYFDIVVSDIKMPRIDGLELLKHIKEKSPDTEVIMMTGFGDIQTAIQAMRLKAYDFLLKPFSFEQLIVIIERALEKHKLETENKAMKIQLDGFRNKGKIICKSQKLTELLDLAKKAAFTNSNVLISGESGSGKELIAWHVHNNSMRKENPYITLNCASIPDTLLESELFGYEKGAFTDAYHQKQGLVEISKGGSLFLDEIGDISLFIQPKLLRFIETGEFRRIGGMHNLSVDVRIIAATNKDLRQEVKAGKFREDLFYRLNVVTLYVPPLRERKEDISPLVEYFSTTLATIRHNKHFSKEAIDYLQSYDWPGNIRELQHVVESAIIFSKNDTIEVSDIPIKISSAGEVFSKSINNPEEPFLSLEEVERIHITNSLKAFNWNQTHSAKALKISTKTLYSKIKKYNIVKL